MAPFAAALVLLTLTDPRPVPVELGAWADRPVARVGGVCRDCPDFDFGPFTPQLPVALGDQQVHEAALDSATDCAWYAFEVLSGVRYRFTTCSPGWATWDTRLELHDPAACGTPLAADDDACGPGGGSTIEWVATRTGRVHLKVAGNGFGPYRLAFGAVGSCAHCSSPIGPLDAVPERCDCVTAELPPTCPAHWYEVRILSSVTISTCPASGCPADAAMGTQLRVWSGSCTTMLTGTDLGCRSPGSENRAVLEWTPPFAGIFRLQVLGDPDATNTRAWGRYTLCVTSSTCHPSPIALSPSDGTTQAAGCSRTQDFVLGLGPNVALPVAYDWSILPSPGGRAVPPSGRVTSSLPGGAATFRSRLTGRGAHAVSVTATNSCGTSSVTQDFELIDATAPFVRAPAGGVVDCPDSPSPAAPQVRDNCDLAPDVALTEQVVPGRCPSEYALRRTWIATDDAGNASAPAVQVVRVRDADPPEVTPDATVAHCVHPPDHGRACFTFTDFTPLATDACPGPVAWVFARVTHDEEAMGACDPPDEAPDVEIAPDGSSFCVRAERCIDDDAVSPGRSYLVEAIATDACGNASSPTPIATILVPQDTADTTACRVPVPWP